MKFKNLKDDSVSGNIELFGNKQIIIDGAKGVIDYSEDFLKIDLGNICLKISSCFINKMKKKAKIMQKNLQNMLTFVFKHAIIKIYAFCAF